MTKLEKRLVRVVDVGGGKQVVVVLPGNAGEWKDPLCQLHAQDLLMELAEVIGVGRRSYEAVRS